MLPFEELAYQSSPFDQQRLHCTTLEEGTFQLQKDNSFSTNAFLFLHELDKRIFQRSSNILVLAYDALIERQELLSCFVCFAVRARAVLGLGDNSL